MLGNVNATRMELLRLKQRLNLARRGHKLLKDKQDELMRQLLEMIDEVKESRLTIEREFQSILARFTLAKAKMGPGQAEEALYRPTKKISLSVEKRNLMSVKVPLYKREVEGQIIPYGYLNTSGSMDQALINFDKFLEQLLNLAEKEKTVQLMADEIEETRRRVNALEYKMIPELEESIKYITMKLAENELSNTVRLMKLKDIVRSH
ncbi:MAG: V-type ATP synthase subunit D [Actinomycetia bacterium]|nr:V-type ATP synthase subunit D [Actinomycetes bacterium]